MIENLHNRPYRILQVLTPPLDRHSGGVQMSTWKLGTHFQRMGHQVSVFSFSNENKTEIPPFELYRSPSTGGAQDESNRRALVEVLNNFKPDVVINHMPYDFAAGNVLAQHKSYLLIGCLRNTLYSVKNNLESYVRRTAPGPLKGMSSRKVIQNIFLLIHRARHRAELRRILEIYDLFVMFGPPNLDELHYFVPEVDEARVRLIPNSIPSVAEQVPAKEKRILWLGRVVEHQKRADLILPIWGQVSKHLTDWQLDVVGEGSLLKVLEQKATEDGLERIHFHGRQAPDEYYRRATIFFMTSSFEGFPNTLVEAQSHAAIPVVFDSYPVAKWIVEHGQNGYLVDPFDVDAMAEQIIGLANHPERQRLAQQSLESAQRFHIERVGQMWQELFDTEVPLRVKPADSQSAA